MARNVLRLSGFTRVGRHEMLGRARDAVSAGGGDLLDFHQFSNVSVCLDFELAPARLDEFRAALARAGLRLSPESLDALARARESARAAAEPAGGGLACALSITFFHDEPDLRLEVPAVPG